jgi:hypothetical protein
MRIGLIIAGLVLIIAGAAAWMGEFEYTKDKEVAKIGSLSATVSTDKTVPQWAGGIAVLVGIGLLAAGAMRKN